MALTYDEERDFIERLSQKYLEKALAEGEFYTCTDLMFDILADRAYIDLDETNMINILEDDLADMCKEECELYNQDIESESFEF